VPINKGYLTKITAERARRERPDFIAPGTTNIEEIYSYYSFALLWG